MLGTRWGDLPDTRHFGMKPEHSFGPDLANFCMQLQFVVLVLAASDVQASVSSKSAPGEVLDKTGCPYARSYI